MRSYEMTHTITTCLLEEKSSLWFTVCDCWLKLFSVSVCEAPWVAFESSCYLFPGSTETWSDAVDACAKEGASLVSIKSQAEQDFVEENMKSRSWLGMSDAKEEGHWVWLADGTDVTYTHWDAGEPNGGTSENYGMIWETVGTWNDCAPGEAYFEKLYYICKK